MGWQQQIVTAPVVIIQSGAAGSGLFIYNGTPASGNPPVLAAVATGVTSDPFGNPVLSVLNIGNFSAAHSGFDAAGIEYLSDSTGTVKVIIDPARGMFFYSGTAALGNPPQLALALSGVTTDTLGNAIGTSKILIQANIITESGGIFRTAATAPLIQLDGPHDAEWIYNAASAMVVAIAAASGNDGLGNAYPGGVSSFVTVTGTFAGKYANNLNDQAQPWGTTVAALTFHNQTNSENLAPAVTAQAHNTAGCNLNLQSGKTLAGSTPATVQVQDSVSSSVTGGLVDVIAGKLTVIAADGNVYRTERLSLFSASTHLFNSATAFTVPGLSASVGIGTYRIEGIVYGVQGPNAANQIVQINGPAISFGRTYIESNADANTSVTDSNISGALPHQHSTPAWGAGVNFYVRFRGIYTFTAAGTLTVQGSTSLVANTWTSQTACLCDLMPV